MKLKPVVGILEWGTSRRGGGEVGVCEISMACLRGAGQQSSVYRLQAKSKWYCGCGREQRALHQTKFYPTSYFGSLIRILSVLL